MILVLKNSMKHTASWKNCKSLHSSDKSDILTEDFHKSILPRHANHLGATSSSKECDLIHPSLYLSEKSRADER